MISVDWQPVLSLVGVATTNDTMKNDMKNDKVVSNRCAVN
jgi:hypothetical protein